MRGQAVLGGEKPSSKLWCLCVRKPSQRTVDGTDQSDVSWLFLCDIVVLQTRVAQRPSSCGCCLFGLLDVYIRNIFFCFIIRTILHQYYEGWNA